jgi:hypothetical protein
MVVTMVMLGVLPNELAVHPMGEVVLRGTAWVGRDAASRGRCETGGKGEVKGELRVG